MNITFLVGNGFDIACGLKTSYKSFYESLFSGQTNSLRVERLKLALKDDINTENNDWTDFELWLGHYTKKYNTTFSEEFMESYDAIHAEMIKFISKERNKISTTVDSSNVVEQLFNALVEFPNELNQISKETINGIISDAKNITFQFITFNYTNCIDLVVEELAKKSLLLHRNQLTPGRYSVKKDVLHIHGSLSEYPVLGVTEDKFIENSEILSNTAIAELLLKEEGIKSVGRTWYRDARDCIRRSQIICVFGASIGSSDSLWWKEIINWMKFANDRHVVVYWYTTEEINTISIYRRNKEIRNVQELLTCHSNLTSQEQKEIRNRIHVVFNSKHMLQIPFEQIKN